jgi:hypothetical protein
MRSWEAIRKEVKKLRRLMVEWIIKVASKLEGREARMLKNGEVISER